MRIWAADQHFLPKLVQDQQLQTRINLLTFERIERYLRHFYNNYVLHFPPLIALPTGEPEGSQEGRSGAVPVPG